MRVRVTVEAGGFGMAGEGTRDISPVEYPNPGIRPAMPTYPASDGIPPAAPPLPPNPDVRPSLVPPEALLTPEQEARLREIVGDKESKEK